MLFVMGASGRVGGALVRAKTGQMPLRAAGHGPNMIPFNVLDASTYGTALDGVTAVFLMRPPHVTKASAFAPFLDACVARDIRRLVVLSVKGAEHTRLLPHHGMEQEVMRRPFAWTMLRPADFMQNLETVLKDDIRCRDQIAVPAGRGASAFVDVADLGMAAAKVLLNEGHAGRSYTLTGSEALRFDQVAEIMSHQLKRRIVYAPPGITRFITSQLTSG